ncbi:hypothetical protein QLY41_21775, partial [Cronobacter sakazakii]|nr:hypothetical protein [Cronobacter sakazakii]
HEELLLPRSAAKPTGHEAESEATKRDSQFPLMAFGPNQNMKISAPDKSIPLSAETLCVT